MVKRAPSQKLVPIGWREWVDLPDLGVRGIKVKVDTGARTSALHATRVKYHARPDGGVDVSFAVVASLAPRRTVRARAKLIEKRVVKSSTGQATERPVVELRLKLGVHEWSTEVTLVNRDPMGFRMLLGRRALRQRFLVNAGRSFLQSTDTSGPP